MLDTRIILSGLWTAVMLTYLWGDVLRIFAGHISPGEILGTKPSQGMWLFVAALMLIPIVMLVLTLTLKNPAIRWANIIVPVLLVVFNLFGSFDKHISGNLFFVHGQSNFGGNS